MASAVQDPVHQGKFHYQESSINCHVMHNAASIDDKGYIKKIITLNLHLK